MKKTLMGIAIVTIAFSCTTQQKVVKVEPQIQEVKQEEQALKRKVAIARFSNETQYAKGVFYDKDNDPIGKQAVDILSTKLASKHWQTGDDVARSDVGWATSEYTTTIRQHLERLKNLIFPLLEQTISVEDEHKVSEEMSNIVFEGGLKEGPEKYIKLIEKLEEELGDWK